MKIEEAYQKWPREEIHNFRVRWERGVETVYAPDMEKAEKWWEGRYRGRKIEEIREQW